MSRNTLPTRLARSVKQINKQALVIGAISSMAFSTSVMAQESGALMEEIEVTGIRSSLKAALDTKRQSSSVVDAINAEDIGKMPDKNVAESLSRITGVSVTRDFGEGEKISVRGSAPSQNRTLLNGAAVASADWFVLDNPSRAFNYTLLPSNVVSSLEVYKSPQADIQEGSIGGTVYLRTRKPLDLDAHTTSIQVQGQYSELSEEWDPMVSAMYSWKNDAETFGALVSLTKQDRTLVRKGYEVLGFEQYEMADGADVWRPRAIGDAFFTQTRERETALVTLEFAPTDNLDMSLNYLDSRLDANNTNNNNYVFTGTGQSGTADESSYQIVDGGVVSGTQIGPTAQVYTIDRDSYSDTMSADFDLNWEGENVAVHFKVGTTEAKGGTDRDQAVQFTRNMHSASFDAGLNTVYYQAEDDIETNEDLLTRDRDYMQGGLRLMEDQEDYFGLDFEFQLDAGPITALKTGIFYRDHDKSQEQSGPRYHWYSDAQHIDLGAGYGGDNVIPGEYNWNNNPDNQNTYADYAQVDDRANYPVVSSSAMQSLAYRSESNNAPTTTMQFLPNTWDVNEEVSAIYVKADFETDTVRGDFGVRYVETDVKSTGYNWNGSWVAASIDQIGGYSLLAQLVDAENYGNYNVRQETETNDYGEFLPNVNLVMDVTDDSVVRVTAARVMSRPDYINIANQESANTTLGNGTRGNPQLEPTTANQFDIAYEWYFDDAAMLAATAFYKDVNGSTVNGQSVESRYDPIRGEFVDVTFQQPVNGRGEEISGLELGYQQDLGLGFGTVINYTYTNADSREERDPINSPGSGLVEGASEHMANITGFYENDSFSTRLSYNYRSDFYDGLSEFGSEQFTEAYGQWDLSLGYSINDNVELIAEAINLNDAKVQKYHISESRASKIYENGRRFVLGANFKF